MRAHEASFQDPAPAVPFLEFPLSGLAGDGQGIGQFSNQLGRRQFHELQEGVAGIFVAPVSVQVQVALPERRSEMQYFLTAERGALNQGVDPVALAECQVRGGGRLPFGGFRFRSDPFMLPIESAQRSKGYPELKAVRGQPPDELADPFDRPLPFVIESIPERTGLDMVSQGETIHARMDNNQSVQFQILVGYMH